MTETIVNRMGDLSASSASASLPSSASRESGLRRIGWRFRRFVPFLLLGFAANVAIAYVLGLTIDLAQGRLDTAEAWTGQHQWTVQRWSRFGSAHVRSVREGPQNWGPGQATGAPDTPSGGDRPTAWASATQDGQAEWLVLEFARAVVPREVRIHESYNPGALTKVSIFTDDGKEVEAWTGVDPVPRGAGMGIAHVPTGRVNFATRKVKLYLDSANVPGWNEIDAVALVGPDGKKNWAVSAVSSSTYGTAWSTATGGAGLPALLPDWAGLDRAGEDLLRGPAKREERAVEARGWPMLALWGEVPVTPAVVGGRGPSGAGMPAVILTGGILPGTGGASAPVGSPGRPALVVRPIWTGMLVNTLFYAVVLMMAYWALTAPLRFVREVGRMRRGCCLACGYDLGFDFVAGCPECGWRRGGIDAARR